MFCLVCSDEIAPWRAVDAGLSEDGFDIHAEQPACAALIARGDFLGKWSRRALAQIVEQQLQVDLRIG